MSTYKVQSTLLDSKIRKKRGELQRSLKGIPLPFQEGICNLVESSKRKPVRVVGGNSALPWYREESIPRTHAWEMVV